MRDSRPRTSANFMEELCASKNAFNSVPTYNWRSRSSSVCIRSDNVRGVWVSSRNTGNSASASRSWLDNFSPEVSKYSCTSKIRSRSCGIANGGLASAASAWIIWSMPTGSILKSFTCAIAAMVSSSIGTSGRSWRMAFDDGRQTTSSPTNGHGLSF